MSQKGNKEWRREDRILLERGMKFVSEIEKYIRIDVGRVQEDARKEKKGTWETPQLAGLWLALSGMKINYTTIQSMNKFYIMYFFCGSW